MKRVLFSLLFLVASLFCFGQSNGEHLKFMGIPIDGTLDSFVAKLKEKGLTYSGEVDGFHMFTGNFAGSKNCVISPFSTGNINLVNGVLVFFNPNETWASLLMEYEHLKELLTEKYGKPSEEREGFTGIQPYSDIAKFQAVLEDRCDYLTEFEAKGGTIFVAMRQSNDSAASVVLAYKDEQNNKKNRSSILDDL